MSNQSLNNLCLQEQRKLAKNIYRLASLYTPYGRIPDMADFLAMQSRIEDIIENPKTINYLWPNAGEKLLESINTAVSYLKDQFAAVEALTKSGAEKSDDIDDLFTYAMETDYNVRRMNAQYESLQGAA